MEKTPEHHAAITIPNHDHAAAQPKPPPRKRKNGAMHVIRVALFMMRRRKPAVLPVDDGSKSIWKKLVCNMRPLHLQDNRSPRSVSISNSPGSPSSDGGMESAAEEPNSPSPPSTRYASAVGLNELVQSDDDGDCKLQEAIVEDEAEEEEEEEEEYFDGDEKIDDKAEEFITKFYQQMKLQRLDSADRRYNERSQRSLGL